MKFIRSFVVVLIICIFSSVNSAKAQCSICAKTTEQMGEKPAKGFNSGIIYLMLAPFAIMGYIGYRWYQGNVKGREA